MTSSMRRLFWIFLLIPWSVTQGQNLRNGEWKSHLSHMETFGTVAKDGFIYTISKGGMNRYDPEFKEINTYSREDGLSGIDPTAIHHAESQGFIFIGYANGLIDFFSNPTEISYLTEISRNTFITQKAINAFASDANRLYIAMESGLVIYDLGTRLPVTDITQFADNPSRTSVKSVTLFDDRVWILLTNGGFYSAPTNFPNLKDPNIWRTENDGIGLPPLANLTQLAANSTSLFALADSQVFAYNGAVWSVLEGWSDIWDRIYVTDNAFGASRLNRAVVKHEAGPEYTIFIEGGVKDICILGPNTFGIATGFLGGRYFQSWDILDTTPSGPNSNDCVRIAVGNGEIYIAPQGYDQALSPTPSNLGVYYYSPDSGWITLNGTSGTLPASASTGFARAYYDQENQRGYLGSWGRGLVEIEQGKVMASATCQDGLSVIFPPCDVNNLGNTRVSGMQLDPQGYLWVSLAFAQDPIMVRTPEGVWLASNRARIPSDDHFLDLLVDDYGNKWIINSRAGLVIYNDRQTPEDPTDDFSLLLRTGVRQGGLPTNNVNCFAKDLDGFVWVGTSQGVTVFYDTYSLSQGNVVDASPPVYQNFGLLKDASVRAIAVDGGNRKWLATEEGVYLVSPSGNEIIYQFNVTNSPLLSNSVNDVKVDPVTGEVFFATSLGLISFQGDATQASSSCEGLFVFPNPVLPEYNGSITIRGTSAGSRVKITTVSGLLVNEVAAEGGTATWDGRDVYGNRVRSGIYLAMASDRNGDRGCIGKFVVLGARP